MSSLTLKRHDTWPPVKTTLEETNPTTGIKQEINLSGAGVKVTMILKTGNEAPIEILGTITSAVKGECEFLWTTVAGSTSTAGNYTAEFEIEWAAGKVETVPNKGYDEIVIEPDLGVV